MSKPKTQKHKRGLDRYRVKKNKTVKNTTSVGSSRPTLRAIQWFRMAYKFRLLSCPSMGTDRAGMRRLWRPWFEPPCLQFCMRLQGSFEALDIRFASIFVRAWYLEMSFLGLFSKPNVASREKALCLSYVYLSENSVYIHCVFLGLGFSVFLR